MLLQNISSQPIVLAGSNTIAAGATAIIEYWVIEDDRNFVGYVDTQQMLVLDAEESFTPRSLPRFTQGTAFGPISVAADTTLAAPLIPQGPSGTRPYCLWLAPFQYARLYLQVTAGSVTLTIQDSPDGAANFFSLPDAPVLSATYGDVNNGKVSAVLPQGLCLVQFLLTSVTGGTCTVKYSRQS